MSFLIFNNLDKIKFKDSDVDKVMYKNNQIYPVSDVPNPDPSYMNGLIVDLDQKGMLDSSGIQASNGEAVETWKNNIQTNDVFGAIQVNEALRPLLRLAAEDGKKELFFDGSMHLSLGNSDLFDYNNPNKEYTVMVRSGYGLNTLYWFSASYSYTESKSPLGLYFEASRAFVFYGERKLPQTGAPSTPTTIAIKKDSANTEYLFNGDSVFLNVNPSYTMEKYEFLIGATNDTNNYKLKGSLRRFAVWNRALTPSEITEVQNKFNSDEELFKNHLRENLVLDLDNSGILNGSSEALDGEDVTTWVNQIDDTNNANSALTEPPKLRISPVDGVKEIKFNGNNNLNIVNGMDFQTNDEFTIAMQNGYDDCTVYAFGKMSPSNVTQYSFGYVNRTGYFHNGRNFRTWTTNSPSIGEPINLILQRKFGHTRVIENGVVVYEDFEEFSVNSFSQYPLILGGKNNDQQRYTGSLRRFHIWNKFLDLDDVNSVTQKLENNKSI